MTFKRYIASILFVISTMSTSSLYAQSQDPQLILDQSRSALKELPGFSAQFKMYGEGGSMFADTLPSMSGRLMMGTMEDLGKVIHIIGESRDQKSSQPVAVDFIIAKDKFLWTDHTDQTINEAPRKSNIRGAPSALSLVFVDSIILEDPFSNDTDDAQSMTVGTQETIAGTLCDVVVIKRADPSKKSKSGTDSYTDVKWFIGTEDKLPRKVERITDAGMLKLSLLFDLGKLRMSVPPANQLDIARPSGYTFKSRFPKDRPIQTKAPATTTTPDTRTTIPVAPRARMMPAFTFTSEPGSTIDNSTQAGRVTVLYFWGSWCTPCTVASPLVSAMSQDYASAKVDVFGVAIRENDHDETRTDFREANNHHTLVLDGEHLTGNLRVRVYPTIVIIDAAGEIVFQESISKDLSTTKLVENAKKAIGKALVDES